MPYRTPEERNEYAREYHAANRERRNARRRAVSAAQATGQPSPFRKPLGDVAARSAARRTRYAIGDTVRFRDRSSGSMTPQLARIERICGPTEHDGMMYLGVVRGGVVPLYDSEIIERISSADGTAEKEQAG